MNKTIFYGKYVLLFFAVVLVGLFFYYPVLVITVESFYDEKNRLTFENFREILGNRFHRNVIIFTIKQSFYSVLASLFIGIPAAYIFARRKFFGKRLLESLFLIPFVVPGVIVAFGFILLFGNNGYINNLLRSINLSINILYSVKAIILAHAFYNFPIVMKMVGQSLEGINLSYYKAASTLGANRLQIFSRITVPAIVPAIINASALIFIYCFMSFSIVLILGGVRYTTIEVNIYMLVNNLFNLRLGMALGVIQIAISFILINVSSVFNEWNRKHLMLSSSVNKDQTAILKKTTKKLRLISTFSISAYLSFLIIILLGPLFSVLFYSFSKDGMKGFSVIRSLLYNQYNPYLGTVSLSPLYNSLTVAIITVFLTLSICLIFSLFIKVRGLKKLIEVFTFLPLGVSAVTFSLGYIRIINLNYANIPGVLLLSFAHTSICLPFASRIVFQGVYELDNKLIWAAELLGVRTLKKMKMIILPLLKRTLYLSGIFTFAISLGEFGAAMILRQKVITIPVAIYRFMGSYRFNEAAAFAGLMIIMAGVSFYTAEIYRDNS